MSLVPADTVAGSPEARAEVRGLPFAAYFAFLAAIFAASAVASVVFVSHQTSRDARARAGANATFAATAGAKKLGADIALLRATVGGLVSNPSLAHAPANAAGCTLTFGTAGTNRDHLDILRADGTVVCSSRARIDGRLPGYVGEPWVRAARSGPLFRAPAFDRVTGRRAQLYAAPAPGGNVIVAAFTDVTKTARSLSAIYGGVRSPEFVVTDRDTGRVISRSIRPEASIGALMPRGTGHDLEGARRIYASAPVPGTPWSLTVGEDQARVLAAGVKLRNEEMLIVLSSLLLVLLATLFVHRRAVRPMKALSQAVHSTAMARGERQLAVAGPREVRALAEEINAMTSVVNTHEAVRRAKEEAERAKDDAERANEAKSRFLSHMSHEIRTPLAAIMGFAELLQRQAVDEKQREWSSFVLDGGRHLLALVNELLELSRIESGKVTLAPTAVDVQRAVGEVLDLVGPLANDRGVGLERRGVPGPTVVRADPVRLKQILLNLVANGINYNSEGGAVFVTVDETADGNVAIAVADTGQGIAPENVDSLFTPFERLGAEQGKVTGSGLGLVVTKGLVEAMDGSIRVASEVGVGTTFTVELPIETAEGVSAIEPPRPATSGSVLYIDDVEENLQLVASVLSELRPGLDLRTSTHGVDGALLAAHTRPDLLLLDLNLPDIAGEEVLRRLRARPKTVDVPVIVLSADSTSRNINRLLQSGADAYLTKPLDVPQFLDVVDRLLSTTAVA